MTDGLIGDEGAVVAEAQRLLGGARLFGFGVGSSVNHFLLSRLSELGRGFYQYVRTDEDPGPAVERFVRRIARPLLTDVQLDWGSLAVTDVLPREVPDLFDAQPLIVLGRYREPGSGVVTLTGRVAGKPVTFSTPVTFSAEPTEGTGLATMWARARVEALDRQQHWGEAGDAVEAITTLGLEYHLVTAYTSLVAVDSAPVTAEESTTVPVPTEPPDQMPNVRAGAHALFYRQPVADQPETVRFGHGAGQEGEVGDEFDDAFGPANLSHHSVKPGPRTRSGFLRAFAPDLPQGFGAPRPAGAEGARVSQAIFSHEKALTACTEAQHRLQPSAHGRLTLTWTVGPDGKATRIEVAPRELERTPFALCVIRVVQAMLFTVPEAPFEVELPLEF
jgi:hypothetical protein